MTQNWKHRAETALISLGALHVVTIQDLQSYARLGAQGQPSASAITRWVRALNDTGKLHQVTRGVYLNRLAGQVFTPPRLRNSGRCRARRRGAPRRGRYSTGAWGRTCSAQDLKFLRT